MIKMRVVAFGDSLTVGYQSPTTENPFYLETPYVDFISEKVYASQIEFIIKGISGELTEEMLRRFNRDVIALKPDYVIILGGANDIGWGIKIEVIRDNLFSMCDMALNAGIAPILVTVPSIRGFDSLIHPRKVLNNEIIDYCTSRSIIYIDYFKASAESDTLRLKSIYSNDGLHLSTAGYKLLGEMLYKDVFKKILS